MERQHENRRKRIGERLIEGGFITRQQLDEALELQKRESVFLGDALERLGYLTRERMIEFLSYDRSSLVGERLIAASGMKRDQFYEALAYQRANGGRIGSICVELGFITEEQLRRATQPVVREKHLLGEELIRRELITEEQLERALDMQKRSGGKLGDILLYQNAIEENDLYRVLADMQEMGRVGEAGLNENAISLPYDMALRLHAVVVREARSYVVVAVENKLSPEAVREIEAFTGKRVEQAQASFHEYFSYWETRYRSVDSEKSVFGLADDHPENSAIVTFTSGQIVFILLMLAALVLCFVAFREKMLVCVMIVLQVIYMLMALGKFYMVIAGAKRNSQMRFTPEEVDAVRETELPVYTVLIPVYREKEVIAHLLHRIENMDYPKYKLDVRILLEEDDTETIELVQKMHLPAYFTPVIVPFSQPKTKPKACNYGLIGSRGEYVVIYDAEDRPERDQLKKAYLAFQRLPKEYVCIQAKLNYFNSTHNWLTKLFTQEYSMWFELLLPGIMQVDTPIPLGGTSNHFRSSFLKEVGGWDPFNVTEDADLGIRLYKFHYKTAVLDSRTWEEANCEVKNWIRQRSRWIKGYMQTFFVHMRRPIHFFRTLGLKGTAGYLAMIFGTPFLPLINPIFWALLVVWLLFQPQWVQAMFPGMLYYVATIHLVFSNFVFVYMNMVGTYYVIRDCSLKHEQPFSYGIIRYGLLTPLYWVLMSVAAYKALFQLFRNPFYWEKTNHGLTQAASGR